MENNAGTRGILLGETSATENTMITKWRHFSKIVEKWIEKHGKDAGYDRPGGFNAAEMWKSPVGWFQDAGKYCVEAYDQADRSTEEWDTDRLMRLCWKIAHCSEIAFSRIIERAKFKEPDKGD